MPPSYCIAALFERRRRLPRNLPRRTRRSATIPKRTRPIWQRTAGGAANSTGGAAANIAFARWLNRPVAWAEDFEPNDRWENLAGGDWQLGEWETWKKAVKGRRLILSVPLLAGGWDLSGPKQGGDSGKPVSLADGAKGAYNVRFQRLAENLVRHGLGDSILRLGWEFNGGWHAWRAGGSPDDFAGYWRQIVKTMRAAPGTEKMQFCWNPASGYQQFPAEKAWPGEDVVDIVGLDLYDDSWAADTYPPPDNAAPETIAERRKKVWNDVLLNGDHGLIYWKDFAVKHKKPFALPEWGVDQRGDKHGGGDDPEFIEQMARFIATPANRVYFHCYFDVEAGDGGHQLSPGIGGAEKTRFPLSAAVFLKRFRVPSAAKEAPR